MTTGQEPGAAGRSAAVARQVADRILPTLDRAVPVVRALALVVRLVAAWCGLALVLIVVVALHRGLPEQWAWWVPVVVLVFVLVLPPVVLWLFARALAELAELPAAIRRAPELLLDHKGDLVDLITDTRTQLGERGRGVTKLPGNLWRAAKLARRVHGDLPEYGEAIHLVNPAFLVLVAAALVFALFEAFVVPLLLLGALVLAL
jgi:hypothetical protein